MKILIATHYFVPHLGGIENVAFNQAKMLAANGHDLTVVTSAIPKEFDEKFNFKILRVSAWNVLENKLGVPFPLFSPGLYGVLKREVAQADVVHAHGHVYLPSVIAARLSTRYKKPFILTQHNTFIEYKSPVLRSTQNLADRILGKPTLSRATSVITVSKATEEYMSKILPVKSFIQYNGVDTARFKPTKDQKTLRQQLSLPFDKKICFTIRRITFKNGIDTVIECANILKKHSEILFVIGGKGSDLDLARKMIKEMELDNVLLLGAVSDKDLPSYYAASDIFILPSKKGEGFPLVVLEALASGIPVIATRSGGHVEILESSDIGYLVDPDSPEQMATKISELAAQPKRLGDMKRMCRQFAEQDLSWEKNVGTLLNIFDKAIA